MKIIFAQGNPGTDFAGTRHNVGFVILDKLADKLSLSFVEKPKFNAMIADTTIDGEKVLLVKPLTFYNDTGLAARILVDFYKLDPAHDLLVVHDDLSLPLGIIRVRDKGSDAGNNGIKSINAHLGENYHRLRVGTWIELRNKIDDVDFVLRRFTADGQKLFDEAITPKCLELIDDFSRDKLQVTSYNLV